MIKRENKSLWAERLKKKGVEVKESLCYRSAKNTEIECRSEKVKNYLTVFGLEQPCWEVSCNNLSYLSLVDCWAVLKEFRDCSIQPLFSFMIWEDGMQCKVSTCDQVVTLYQDSSRWFSTKGCELNIHGKESVSPMLYEADGRKLRVEYHRVELCFLLSLFHFVDAFFHYEWFCLGGEV